MPKIAGKKQNAKNILEDNLVSPKSDVMFKKLFGSKENLHLLKDLLSTIIEIPVEEIDKITLENTEQLPNYNEGKRTVCDVKITLKSEEIIQIEMQRGVHSGLRERVQYYNSKNFTDSVKSGEQPNEFHQSITILIIDENIFHDDIDDYHDILCVKSIRYDRIWTRVQEIHVIELQKIHTGLNSWFDFVKAQNLEEMKMAAERNPMINEAIDVVKYFSADEMVRHQALSEECALIDDFYRMKDAREEGHEEGMEEGMEKGMEKGREEEKGKIAKNMLERGLEISLIMELTGLPKERIMETAKSMSLNDLE